MKRMKCSLVVSSCIAVVLLAAGVARAAGVSVNCPPYGTDDLQAAISGAAVGATVSVKGVCAGNFDVDRNLVVQGSPAAVLDGNQAGRTLVVEGGAVVTLRNLTIRNGRAHDFGGGLFADSFSTVSVLDSTVTENQAGDVQAIGYGGGVYVKSSATVNLTNTKVIGNVAAYGGGIDMDASATVDAVDSIISANKATSGAGGGIDAIFGAFSTIELERSTVSANKIGRAHV